MKHCSKCDKEKPVIEYYKNTNKCKECTKASVRANRKSKVEYYRERDRARGSRLKEGYIKSWRAKYPNKYKAQTKVGNALRDGKIKRMPCEVCGKTNRVHAHHDNYLRELDVRWLCVVHHKQWHDKNGEAKNGR